MRINFSLPMRYWIFPSVTNDIPIGCIRTPGIQEPPLADHGFLLVDWPIISQIRAFPTDILMIFLGIDCGTQSTKTIALDAESGEVLASASHPHGFIEGLSPGHMEQNPSDWTTAADATIRAVLAKLGTRRSDVRGIGVSGQQHGLVVLDSDDTVIRPAKLWCDTSTSTQCQSITAHFGGPHAVIDQVGNAMLPGYTAPKILWLRENEPEHWARVRSVLLPHDFLNFWLTGRKSMEFGDASGTALLDVRKRNWSETMINHIAPELLDYLPAVGSSLNPAGTLSATHQAAWGLEANVVVSAGGGDNMMGAIGTGNTVQGTVTASLGTSGTLFACANQPVIDPQGEVAGFCDSTDHWLPLICTMNVTLVTELTRNLFGWDHQANDAAVQSVSAGTDGLLLLPYLVGERTPNLPKGCGILHGLSTHNFTPAHFARAAMEGVTLGLGYGLSRLRDLGVEPTEIRLTGGGSNSAAWRKVAANVFQVPVVCLQTGEGAALGAAIQAAWTQSGSSNSVHDFAARFVQTDPATRVEPDPNLAEVHEQQMERAARLRRTLGGDELL
jgi:xylulokinase